MKFRTTILAVCLLLPIVGGCASAPERADDPLPSWRDTAARTAIIDFIERVTDSDGPDFVPVAERVAVFDNDGTLWAEQPMYFQFDFAVELARRAVAERPELGTEEPFRTAIEGEPIDFLTAGSAGLLRLLLATHSGTTTDEFSETGTTWFRDARHPTTGLPYTAMVYQPMLELLEYLERNEFSNWIVSGGDADFIRVFADVTYGIPPERVIGSQMELEHRSTPEDVDHPSSPSAPCTFALRNMEEDEDRWRNVVADVYDCVEDVALKTNPDKTIRPLELGNSYLTSPGAVENGTIRFD